MIKKIAVIVSSFIILNGCGSAPARAPMKKPVVEQQQLSGCDKYLSPESTSQSGCTEGDCNNGSGIFVYDNGDCYEGYNSNNIRHGQGVMHYKTWGEKYSGTWVNDNRVGRGTLSFNNGDTYTGEFKLNVPWGIGTYRYADGSIEQGEFFDYLFVNTIKLPGLTDEDKVEVGKVTNVDTSAGEVSVSGSDLKAGDKLFVEINGLMAAMEVIITSEQESGCRMIGGTRMLISKVYDGMPVFTMMSGIKRGNNTFLFPNGNRYIGEYKGNQMNGKGEFFWTNGNIYKGDFKNGMRYGKGSLTYYNGSTFSGDWKNGYMEGKGLYTWSNGNKYTGDFTKGFREGQATFVWGNGDKYVGSFKKNLQDGEGTYFWSDGGRYEGQWKDHKMHGKGVEYSPDGEIIQQGLWDNGTFTGEGI